MMGRPNRPVEELLEEDTYSIHFWGRRMRAFLLEIYDGIPPSDSLIGRLVEKHEIDVKSAPLKRKT